MSKVNCEKSETTREKRIGKIAILIDAANNLFNSNGKQKLVDLLETQKIEARICSKCDKIMIKGYCIKAGEGYYCNEECLKTEMNIEEFNELYNNGEGDSYYTEWN